MKNRLRGERSNCKGIRDDLYGPAGSAVLARDGPTSLRCWLHFVFYRVAQDTGRYTWVQKQMLDTEGGGIEGYWGLDDLRLQDILCDL